MEMSGSATSFEVYCPKCRVTFPMGSKRCMHCGGRLSAQRGGPDLTLHESDDLLVDADAEPTRRGISPLTLMWIVLLVGGYLYRACTGG